jgi:ATP-dependent Clp protease ATP-binding subunit ClpA
LEFTLADPNKNGLSIFLSIKYKISCLGYLDIIHDGQLINTILQKRYGIILFYEIGRILPQFRNNFSEIFDHDRLGVSLF